MASVCRALPACRSEKSSELTDPRPPDHVIGSPLALAEKTYADKAWVEFKNVLILQRPNVRFVQGSVVRVDCEAKTAVVAESATRAERTETYDFFIAATGLRRVWPVVPQALSKKTYMLEVGKHIDAVANSTDPVLVVGGGKSRPGPPPPELP